MIVNFDTYSVDTERKVGKKAACEGSPFIFQKQVKG